MATDTFGSAYDPRRNNFDALRFALATQVIWSHSYVLSGRGGDWIARASGEIDGGALAVDSFFIVSGFLVTQSWMQTADLPRFLVKRSLRIVPTLVVAVVFGAFVIGPIATTTPIGSYLRSPGPWWHLLAVVRTRYLYCPGLFVANPSPALLNGSLWSLRWEIGCYALVVALGSLARARLHVVVGAVFVAAWGVTLTGWRYGDDVPWFVAARLMACFTGGMIAYLCREQVPHRPALAGLSILILVAASGFGVLREVWPAVGAYAVLYLAFADLGPLAHFGRYGDFSYGLYAYAFPIQQLIIQWLGAGIRIVVLFAATWLVTLGVAMASWHLVEAPALARKPRAALGHPMMG